MKPGQPLEPKLEQGHGSASSLDRRERDHQAAESPAHRQPFAGGASPASGWRLPSGQLLVEYALQTCFAGSPLARPAFAAGAKEGDGGEPATLEAHNTLADQLTSLHGAVGGSQAPAPSRRNGRATAQTPPAKRVRRAGGKERARS